MKEGVLNEKLALKKLLTYITSVYKIPQKINYNNFDCLCIKNCNFLFHMVLYSFPHKLLVKLVSFFLKAKSLRIAIDTTI